MLGMLHSLWLRAESERETELETEREIQIERKRGRKRETKKEKGEGGGGQKLHDSASKSKEIIPAVLNTHQLRNSSISSVHF